MEMLRLSIYWYYFNPPDDFQFNNKYSVQPQNNEVLESLIKFA